MIDTWSFNLTFDNFGSSWPKAVISKSKGKQAILRKRVVIWWIFEKQYWECFLVFKSLTENIVPQSVANQPACFKLRRRLAKVANPDVTIL